MQLEPSCCKVRIFAGLLLIIKKIPSSQPLQTAYSNIVCLQWERVQAKASAPLSSRNSTQFICSAITATCSRIYPHLLVHSTNVLSFS